LTPADRGQPGPIACGLRSLNHRGWPRRSAFCWAPVVPGTRILAKLRPFCVDAAFGFFPCEVVRAQGTCAPAPGPCATAGPSGAGAAAHCGCAS
jgi:hypothetical protein